MSKHDPEREEPMVLASADQLMRPATRRGFVRTQETDFALSPGGGVRIPLPGIFELRADARDVIVFGSRTTHNPEFTAGLNLRF